MDEAKRRLVVAWCAKAEEDLKVARLLIAEENRLFAAGVYHCQQAAEKALKAWLTCRDIVFPKTHDLEALVHLCATAQVGFSAYAEHARELTPLATEFRYPGDLQEPEPLRARHVLVLAEEVVRYSRQIVQTELGAAEPPCGVGDPPPKVQ